MTEHLIRRPSAASEEHSHVMTETSETSTNATVEEATAVPSVFEVEDLAVYYGDFKAVREVTLKVRPNEIVAFIGPSGCGKSTVLRCFNRMNDTIVGARVEGSVKYHGVDLYAPEVSATQVRRHIGMVFQKPNPFPKSVYDNVAYGPRIAGGLKKSELDDVVEESLRGAALWDEVKDRLKSSGLGLSGGQQQRLCIARALATRPRVLLLDEPTASLDPLSSQKVEELVYHLRDSVTVVIVTHNMQQAARISDRTAFLLAGELIEFASTNELFTAPRDPRTESYITGRFG